MGQQSGPQRRGDAWVAHDLREERIGEVRQKDADSQQAAAAKLSASLKCVVPCGTFIEPSFRIDVFERAPA